MIQNGKIYKIKNSPYFKDKYGNPSPKIEIEGLWTEIYGKSWMICDGHPGCLIYAMRSAFEELPTDDKVYYGKIGGLGELVHESELVK